MDVAESTLHIIDDRGEVLVSVSIDPRALDALQGYLRACAETPIHKQLRTSLCAAMDAAIQQTLPYHLRRPSEAQLRFALGIAKTLDVPVPPEALSQRWAMHAFLDGNVETYRLRQSARGTGTEAPRAQGLSMSRAAEGHRLDEPPGQFE